MGIKINAFADLNYGRRHHHRPKASPVLAAKRVRVLKPALIVGWSACFADRDC
jgi:hypothetical protein